MFLAAFWVLDICLVAFSVFEASIAVEEESFVTFTPGNINLLLSAPHGGLLEPDNVPDRRNGCNIKKADPTQRSCNYQLIDAHLKRCAPENLCKITTVTDSGTKEMTLRIADKFEELSGSRPHVLVANLKRTKVDFNRHEVDGAQSHPLAVKAYREYHRYLGQAVENMTGPGLVIDVHGQNHKKNSTEIGYLFLPKELNDQDYSRYPSVRSMMDRHSLSPEEILSGSDSMGSYFELEGYKAVPSPRQPTPGEDKYYRGGFITQTYGSSEGGSVDAIQLELPAELRYGEGTEVRNRFADKIAAILWKFYKKYYL